MCTVEKNGNHSLLNEPVVIDYQTQNKTATGVHCSNLNIRPLSQTWLIPT